MMGIRRTFAVICTLFFFFFFFVCCSPALSLRMERSNNQTRLPASANERGKQWRMTGGADGSNVAPPSHTKRMRSLGKSKKDADAYPRKVLILWGCIGLWGQIEFRLPIAGPIRLHSPLLPAINSPSTGPYANTLSVRELLVE